MKKARGSVATFMLCAAMNAQAFVTSEGTQSHESMLRGDLEARVKALLTKARQSLRLLKGGTFDMGDWGTESGMHYDVDLWSRPVHKVTLDTFMMMAYKVTYDDFDVFTDATGNERVDMDEVAVQHRAPKRPAGVNWYGAKAYCEWLQKMTHIPFDLPTEAQWEYAARSGGKKMLFATDNGKIERGRNFPEEWKLGQTKPPLPDVGSYPPNPVGLFGMSENTGEWVGDWFDEDYYKKSPAAEPKGPENGTMKAIRGSVGGTAEIAAMVFMRTRAKPQTLRPTYPDGIAGKELMVPFSGYSSYKVHNFRCAANIDHIGD